jgi:hypothetical protein
MEDLVDPQSERLTAVGSHQEGTLFDTDDSQFMHAECSQRS